jgi:hypothetical protein
MESWRENLFQLCWHQHGGSGVNVDLSEAMEMTPADRDWFLERIGDQRSSEVAQLEKAAKRR